MKKTISVFALLLVSAVLIAQIPLTSELLFNQKRVPQLNAVKWVGDTLLVLTKYTDSVEYFTINPSNANLKSISKNTFNHYMWEPAPEVKDGYIYFDDQQIVETNITPNNITLCPNKNSVAYTKNNNLYFADIKSKKETQLTSDGSNVILNGYASWVYMEEILGRWSNYKAFWWSPDGKKIAFYRFDDSDVPAFTFTDGTGKNGYVETMRYPKAGDNKPVVKIGIADVETGKIVWADFETSEDQYFGTPYWISGSTLGIFRANGLQNELELYSVNAKTGNKTKLYAEKQQAWVNLEDAWLKVLNDGRIIFNSDKTGYNHIYIMSANGTNVRQITKGNYQVYGVESIDEKNNLLYFTCNKENVTCTDFYRINLNGENLQKLSSDGYTNNVLMSPGCKYYFNSYSNYSSPIATAVYRADGKLMNAIYNTFDVKDDLGISRIPKKVIPTSEMLTIKSRDGKFNLPARIIRPLNMQRGVKYPLLINVYGGPGAVNVRQGHLDSNSPLNNVYSNEGLIQVWLEHRGSSNFGKTGQYQMYENLGSTEVEDYATWVEYLIINEQVDSSKVCINGFSYGGYITCFAMVTKPNLFTHGIAGGSVTDWLLYDAPYTERYMNTPKNNPQGYKQSSVLTHTHNLQGKLLLTHGVIDENVHLQNTLQLVSKLEDEGKDFELMIYPESRHGYRGEKRKHFNRLQIKFVYKYLLEKPVPDFLLK